MALTLLYSDDFSAYTDQASFEAAYPYDPPGDMTTSVTGPSLVWGATAGPGGVPGLSSPSISAGQFDKVWLTPTCREFKIVGTFDFDYTPGGDLLQNDHYTLFENFWAPAGHRDDDFAGPMVGIARRHSEQVLVVGVRTTAAYATSSPPIFHYEEFSGVTTNGTPVVVEAHCKRSTLTETSPGVWAPETDGFVRVSLDGSQIFSFDGPVWHGRSDLNETPYWNGVKVQPGGNFTNFEIWDSDECDTGVTIRGSAVFGEHTTVRNRRAIAFGLDGATNTMDEQGTLKVFGDLTVTGTASFASIASGTLTLGGLSDVNI